MVSGHSLVRNLIPILLNAHMEKCTIPTNKIPHVHTFFDIANY